MGGGFGGARRNLALFPALYNVVGLLRALPVLMASHVVLDVIVFGLPFLV